MALVPYSLEIIKGLLGSIAKDAARTGRILTLSNPDIIASVGSIESIFGDRVRGKLHIRKDSEVIVQWHKSKAISREVVDTAHLFELLGFSMDAVDIVQGRGNELVHDMNKPIPKDLCQRYDLVFDCISNQCFNVAQAMINAAMACRRGGYVMHVTPITMVNQGFFGVSPTTYHDFYRANHFDMIVCRAVVGTYLLAKELTIHPTARERNVPDDAMNLVVARKKRDHPGVLSYPVMHKFEVHPTCSLQKGERRIQ